MSQVQFNSQPAFNSGKLKNARLFSKITQTELAEKIDVSKVIISKYESGKSIPSFKTLSKISQQLNFPIEYFLHKSGFSSTKPIFFRAFKSAKTKDLNRFRVAASLYEDLVGFFKTEFVVPRVNLPKLNGEYSWEKAEDLAIEVRSALGLTKSEPIPNLLSSLEKNGIFTFRWELGGDKEESVKTDAFSWFDNDQDNAFMILGKDKGAAVRSRFDAAHELGHLVMHSEIKTEEDLKKSHKDIEMQANRFAGAFLFPQEAFINEVRTFGLSLESFIKLKEKWKVSIGAMVYRSCQLGLISEFQKKRLFISISKRGWRTREPLDNSLEIEEPWVIKEYIQILNKESKGFVKQLCDSTNLEMKVIESLLDLELSSLNIEEEKNFLPERRR